MAVGSPLPHGAKGIEVSDFVLEQGRDKIVMLAKSSGDRYTLQAGTRSGVIDLHRTWRDDTGVTHHDTLFAMQRDHLPHLLAAIATVPGDIFRLLRPLRVGWLARHDIGIVHGLDPTTNEQIAAVTIKRKKRLIPDEQQWQAAITVPEYLDDIYDLPDGAFSLFERNRKIGIGFKKTDEHGKARLHWIRLRDLRRLATTWEKHLTRAAEHHAIAPADYDNYPALANRPREKEHAPAGPEATAPRVRPQ